MITVRADMAKIIVERPRTGGRPPKGYYKNAALEDLPKHEGMRKPYLIGGNPKDLNENLRPLQRYLASQVGRPWNKVHSEICKHVKLTSTIQRHILEHLKHLVYTHTQMQNNKVCIFTGYSGSMGLQTVDEIWGHDVLYVHPVTGLLCKRPDRKSAQKTYTKRLAAELATRFRDTKGLFQYHKIQGVWFVVKLAKLPSGPLRKQYATADGLKWLPTFDGDRRDILLGACLDALTVAVKVRQKDLLWETYRRKGVYGVNMKQCNSRELKKAGLKNDCP